MSTELDWNESYYFNLYDSVNDVTVFMRIGNKPNRNEKSMFLYTMEKGRICGMRNAVPCDDDKRSCSGLTFTEDGDHWNISYNGPMMDVGKNAPLAASIQVEWTPINPLMDYHDCVDEKGAQLSSKTASEHFEQFGLVKGRIVLGDADYAIDGTGERDYSEGVRDWGSPKMWLWLNSVYDNSIGFNATKLSTQMGDVDAGYVGTAESNDPVIKIDVELGYDKDMPSSYDMTMHCKSGKSYGVKARILRYATLPMQGSKDMMLIETISETVMDGRTGYGIAELLVPVKRN
ncbi:MAG: hypothetical protein IJT54_02860 [Candidatus Methanomethylophilaceae archaeon]|nr:hypothetical protein [Candidatus Methanomethylophilaceae archaeon]